MHLSLHSGVRLRSRREIIWQRNFAPGCLQMIERCIRRDPPSPGTEVPLRIKPCVSPIDSPKCFHRQVFRYPSVANNTHNPAANLALELPEQSLESFEVALREPVQQFHFPSLCSLTGQSQDWFHFSSAYCLQRFLLQIPFPLARLPIGRRLGCNQQIPKWFRALQAYVDWEVLVLYRKRERARCTHAHSGVARFRYSDLKEAARGCGGRGRYANSIEGRVGLVMQWGCAAERKTQRREKKSC